jgi:hypothetical protein
MLLLLVDLASQPHRRAAAAAAPSAAPTVEGPGSTSHARDAQFCSTHQCIENFPNGHGYIVQCVDGEIESEDAAG